MRRPEVLAPAGDRSALDAAVRAGADAVYFGLQAFNARERARNFDLDALPALLGELHSCGVRGYVALNTLVFDTELQALEDTVRACAAAAADAVIVQDLGVVRLIRAVAPDLPIHASTQMTCTDAGGVELAHELGATRVVLARELSLDDIAAIRAASSVDLEVFVHGALCVAYSGQCLTSEAIGGRSANRGACAQACRLPYELVVDGAVRDLGERAYLLSPEDLEAAALVPRLIDLGVSGLKIEGRLKGADYVGATTALYRRAVDEALRRGPLASADGLDAERRAALQTFTRGSGPGFLLGVDHQRLVEGKSCDHRGLPAGHCRGVRHVRGRDLLEVSLQANLARGDGILVEGGWAGEGEVGGRVWTLTVADRDVERAAAGAEALVWLGPDRSAASARPGRVFITSDPANQRAIAARLEREPARVPIDVRIRGRLGEPFSLEASSPRGHAARVVSEVPVEPARTAPTSAEVLREKIGRLGDTRFILERLEVDLPADAMIPMSAVNRARRQLADALTTSLHQTATPTPIADAASVAGCAAFLATAVPPSRPTPPPGLFVLCRSESQAHAAADAGADGVVLDFLDLNGTGAALRSLRARAGGPIPTALAPPRIRRPGEETIDRYLRDLAPDALLVRSLGALRESGSDPIARIGDFSLNVTNRLTAAEVLERGLVAFTPAFDLDAEQLVALCASPFGPWAEVVVHHPMPLFHMDHCVFAALLSAGTDYKTCGRPCERHSVSLRDRTGMDHPLEADVGCRNTVFHAAPQSAVDIVPRLQAAGVRRFRIELVRESAEDVKHLVHSYRALIGGQARGHEIRRALRTASGYGVVSGSLRVLPG